MNRTSSRRLSHRPQGLSSRISLSSSESSPLSRGDLCSGSVLERLPGITHAISWRSSTEQSTTRPNSSVVIPRIYLNIASVPPLMCTVDDTHLNVTGENRASRCCNTPLALTMTHAARQPELQGKLRYFWSYAATRTDRRFSVSLRT